MLSTFLSLPYESRDQELIHLSVGGFTCNKERQARDCKCVDLHRIDLAKQ
jgi:hypothetical protein